MRDIGHPYSALRLTFYINNSAEAGTLSSFRELAEHQKSSGIISFRHQARQQKISTNLRFNRDFLAGKVKAW
jgi:hypothetical protein